MESVLYGVDERPRGTVLLLSTLQWFVFTLANTITVPIVLGHALGMGLQQAAMFTNRTFFVCGIIGILQVVIGHRLAIIEGPAGMWWGVFLVLIQMTRDAGGSVVELEQQLEMGLIAAALVFLLLAIFRAVDLVRRLFTPAVTGTFLILLAMQVSKSLLQGVLGIGFQGSTLVRPEIAGLSIGMIAFTMAIMIKGKGLFRSLAVLIGLAVGWLVFLLLGMVQIPHTPAPAFAVPVLFPFGLPKIHIGIMLTCIITALILMSNLIASVQAFATAAETKPTGKAFTRGTFMTGVGTLLAGCFGTVGAVPLTAAASLVSLTGIASRLPFLIASVAITLLGLFPSIGQWFVTLPSPVGYAVLFTVFAQLLGFGLKDIKQLAFDQRDLFVVSLSLLAGVGLLFIPGEAWLGIPSLLAYLLDNGLIIGVLMVMLLEHVVFPRKLAKL